MVELVSVNHCPKACEIPRGDRVLPTVLYNPQISASLVQDACRMYGDTVLQYLTVGEAIRNTVLLYFGEYTSHIEVHLHSEWAACGLGE